MLSTNFVQLMINLVCIAVMVVFVWAGWHYALGQLHKRMEAEADKFAEAVHKMLDKHHFFTHNGIQHIVNDYLSAEFNRLYHRHPEVVKYLTVAFMVREMDLLIEDNCHCLRYGDNVAVFGDA